MASLLLLNSSCNGPDPKLYFTLPMDYVSLQHLFFFFISKLFSHRTDSNDFHTYDFNRRNLRTFLAGILLPRHQSQFKVMCLDHSCSLLKSIANHEGHITSLLFYGEFSLRIYWFRNTANCEGQSLSHCWLLGLGLLWIFLL